MNKTKENYILKINTVLLSAFSDRKEISKLIISESDELSDKADSEIADEYKQIRSGEKFELSPQREPNLISALSYATSGRSAKAFWEFERLHKQNKDDIELMKNISSVLLGLKAQKVLLDHFVPTFLPLMKDDIQLKEIVAAVYFAIPEYYKEAIPLYEELVDKVKGIKNNYNYRLAFLYERVYQDKKTDIQIKYLKRALNEKYNKNLVYTFLAKVYYRRGEKEECKKYLDKMMKNSPLAENIVSYSRFLMKEGKITEGYDLYRCRFDTGNVAYPDLLLPEKRWDGEKDISDSTVLVHYEQGFGDSVMFARYIPELSKMAKKVVFVVQKNLIPILKSSGYDKYCEILSHEADINPNITLKDTNRSVMYSSGKGMGKIPHDYHIPLMDTPFLLKENPKKMSQAKGYFKADPNKVKEFKKKYINKNKKLKIGLAYHGTKESILTYRDISVKKFLPLLKMKNIEFYSFQADVYAQELKELDPDIKIIDLGKEFKNFEDTACAIECMDLIISTDNVVMNLAGALGKRTYGLFNVYSESRWYKTEGNDVGWYKSIKPFRAKTFNDWDNLMLEVKDSLINEYNL